MRYSHEISPKPAQGHLEIPSRTRGDLEANLRKNWALNRVYTAGAKAGHSMDEKRTLPCGWKLLILCVEKLRKPNTWRISLIRL